MTTTLALHAILGTLAGVALGLLFFRGLAAGVRLTLEGEATRAVPLHLLRLGAAGAGFTAAVLLGGAAALLGMLAGFQAAKAFAVRRAP